ncbi:LLM class flavin-dependent oxidoreductase [Pseudonocardia sp. CA-142604]|uniref:LLM class flavin-dependent oxidoreductase n=1 Tax=Pseudonocardia sp. CA-142604 TaxID=3240024 RepID=UPI003D927DFC
MTVPVTPLSVLDLSPISSGSTVAEALQHTVDLARHAERLGYRRFWLAEHHLNPGVAGSVPALLIAAVARETHRIRVGSGAVQTGHRTPLSVVEEFGTLDALYPGRIDLGLGRSGGPRTPSRAPAPVESVAVGTRTVGGVVIPSRFSHAGLLASPRFRAQAALIRQPDARTPPYPEVVEQVLALFEGSYRTPEGVAVQAVPGSKAGVEPWILGSSGGESAEVAGARGLPFAANYHVSPSSVLEAVEGYRGAFRPSARLAAPYVMVSADVVVGPDDETARELAAGYAPWVRSIRTGVGAIPFPTPAEAAALTWTDEERKLVADRVATQFVGSAGGVVDRLRALRDVTAADELLITTITHGHADRVRSYELLATAWAEQS